MDTKQALSTELAVEAVVYTVELAVLLGMVAVAVAQVI